MATDNDQVDVRPFTDAEIEALLNEAAKAKKGDLICDGSLFSPCRNAAMLARIVATLRDLRWGRSG